MTFLQCKYSLGDFTQLTPSTPQESVIFSLHESINYHVHIGFDAKRLFHNFTGLGNYSRTLVANLKSFYPDTTLTLFSPKSKPNDRTEHFFDHTLYHLYEGRGAAWRTWSIYKDINNHHLDIFHGLSHQIPFSSDRIECKTVVTVHDLIQRIRPKDFPAVDRMIYERKCKYACANADVVIAISENTKRDIMKYYRTPAERIKVVYQSCSRQFSEPIEDQKLEEATTLFSLPDEYYLSVGSVTPRKNLLAIIEALADIPEHDRIPLLVIGSGRKYMGKVLRAIEKRSLGAWVEFLGDVPFDLFPAIYNRSTALVYPSLYEGFGIPVIEALSVGTPVITSNTSSLPEAGGDVSIYVDPSSREELKQAMLKVRDPGQKAEDCVKIRQRHAAMFAPAKTTGALCKVYKEVLGIRD